MRLSDDRINHLSHLIMTGLKDQGGVKSFSDNEKALVCIKRVIISYLKMEDEVDEKAREKIAAMSKKIPEGSPEWEVLYRKYVQEELNKLNW